MEFNENVIYEPDCFAIRRMPAHSDHGYYATGKEADGVESSFLTSLNGRWKFAYANNLAEVIEGFYRKDYDAATGMRLWCLLPYSFLAMTNCSM